MRQGHKAKVPHAKGSLFGCREVTPDIAPALLDTKTGLVLAAFDFIWLS
jgi:hypothetical protein